MGQLLVDSHPLQSELLDNIRVQLRGGGLLEESLTIIMLCLNKKVSVCLLVLMSLLLSLSHSAPITDGIMESARVAWNSWQEFERENLPWLYRCGGPIGLFCPGPGPDVYDIIPDLPQFPGIIPPPQNKQKSP